MIIYTIRHGQTDWNIKGLLQGNVDTDLNEEGINQAYIVKEKLKNIKFDICYSSPLTRAKHTANIIMDNKDIVILPELEERDFGMQEGKLVPPMDVLKKAWDLELDDTTDKIEPLSHILKRTDAVKKYILSQKYNTILVVSHGSALKAFHYNMIGYDKNTDFMSFRMENCEINKYIIENDKIVHTKLI